MKGRWDIAELTEAVAAALGMVGGVAQRSGRVREVPDLRAIRYYTTVGLLDPPAEMRGRKAFYGRKHLLQVLAVKRLQTAGRSLLEIQQAILGIGNAALERLAELPPGFWQQLDEALAGPLPAAGDGSPATTSRELRSVNRTAFWKTVPAAKHEPLGAKAIETVPAIHLRPAPELEIVLHGVREGQWTDEVRQQLARAVDRFSEELRRLGLAAVSRPQGRSPGPDVPFNPGK